MTFSKWYQEGLHAVGHEVLNTNTRPSATLVAVGPHAVNCAGAWLGPSGALAVQRGRDASGPACTFAGTPLEPAKLHCWYADHEVVTLPDGHRFPMAKYRATRELLQSETQMSAIARFHPSPHAPLRDLQRVHTSEYVQRFGAGTLTPADARAIGFPWSQSLVRRNFASVGGTLAATQALLEQPGLRIAAHISGGTHHAFAGHGEGFCVFNDIAVAAAYALEVHSLERVLVIDLDVHQGNGTADIFARERRVVTFDMYCGRNYPWTTRRTATYDVPLEGDTGDEEYLDILSSWLERLAGEAWDLIFYQAGVDLLAADSLGKMRLSRNAINARNNLVYSMAISAAAPLVITMGGGYARPDIKATVDAHADVYRTAALRLAAVVSSDKPHDASAT